MKITPLDIRRKEFKRSMRGYSDEEVDIFLDQVADEFERIFQENMELQDRLQRLDEQIAGHAQLKDALEKTLVSAQIQAEELRSNARKESELILRDAELKARGVVSASYGETQKTQQALVQLKLLEEDFRIKFRALLEGYLRLVNEAPLAVTAAEPASHDAAEAQVEPDAEPVVALAAECGAPSEFEAPETKAPGFEAPEAETPAPAPEPPVSAFVPPPAPAPEPPSAAAEQPIFRPVPPPSPGAAAAGAAAAGAAAAGPLSSGPAAPRQSAFEERWPVEGLDEDTATDEIPTAEVEVALDGATVESDLGIEAPGGDTTKETDLLHGFFFGRRVDDVDDTFPGEDGIKKDKTRDFEW